MDLVARFENIEDFSDPTLIEDLQILLEDIQSQDEEFMQLLLKKRHEMVITWAQPWYQEIGTLTRPLQVKDEKNSETFRIDAICSEERELIDRNWKKFRKTYGIPNKPECLARWRNKDRSRAPNTPEESARRFVMAYLAQGLKRTVHRVYKFFITHYGNPIRGSYTLYEKKIMKIALYHSPHNVVPYLSTVLGREPRGIYKKLQEFSNGKTIRKKKFRWTLPLCTKFLRLLIQYTGEPLENLQNKRFETDVWMKLEEAMDKERVYLQMFWYNNLHVQLFVKCNVLLNKIRKKFFKKLKLFPYKIWSDIRWKDVVKLFPDGYTHGFLYQCVGRLFKRNQEYRQRPLSETIERGLRRIKCTPNKRLKTLIFNEKQELEYITYE